LAGRLAGRRPSGARSGDGNGERSVEAVGIEVERLGEGQRFITRLFTEKDTTRAPGEGVPEPVKNKGQS